MSILYKCQIKLIQMSKYYNILQKVFKLYICSVTGFHMVSLVFSEPNGRSQDFVTKCAWVLQPWYVLFNVLSHMSPNFGDVFTFGAGIHPIQPSQHH